MQKAPGSPKVQTQKETHAMPRNKRRATNIEPICTYAEAELWATRFAEGRIPLWIFIGNPGLGKSRIVESAVLGEAVKLKGHASAFGMYTLLAKEPNVPVVIDDIDSLYSDRNFIRLLKSLCETEGKRKVKWDTNAVSEDESEFETTANVVIITNDWKTLTENVRAVEDRGFVVSFEPGVEEIHRKAGTYFPERDGEIYSFIDEHLHLLPGLSLRIYEKALTLKNAEMDWRSYVLRQAKASDTTVLVAKLKADQSYSTEEARVKAFIAMGGGSRSSYFNHAAKLRRPIQVA